MARFIFRSEGQRDRLPSLLEGYLYGLGETCHNLFGPEAETAVYTAIGRFFSQYLHEKLGLEFTHPDPWKRYCQILEAFTSHGFYTRVELEELGQNRYWMLETGQFAGEVWDEQKAWERGTPPCPLWATILSSLAETGHSIHLDEVTYKPELKGYESTFHFERLAEPRQDPLEAAAEALRGTLVPICYGCRKVRDQGGQWLGLDKWLTQRSGTRFSHVLCSGCADELDTEVQLIRDGLEH